MSQPVAFAPDGKHIASFEKYDMPPTIGLWDAATGKRLRKLTAPGAAFNSADPVFSPDGKRLAGSGYCSGLLHVWDVETGKDLSQINEHQAIVCSVAFSADGRTVLTGCADSVIRIWDADKGTVVRRIEVDQVLRDVSEYQIAFSKDRKGAAVIGAIPSSASLWNLDSGKMRARLDDGRYGTWVAGFAPDGKTLAARGNNPGNNITGIQIWDSATGKKVSKNMIDAEGQGTFAFSPDGKTLVVDGSGELAFWDVAQGKETRKWSLPNGRTDRLRFAPSGSMIAGAGDGGVDLWNAATGKVLPPLRLPEMEFPASLLDCLAFSADGKTVAAAGRTGVIYVWDVGTAKMRDVLTGHRDWVTSLDFSPDGARLISGSRDATALIWDLTGVADEKGAKTLTPERLASLWNELADGDAGKAWRAGWRLTGDPAASVPFLQKHLWPAEVDAVQIAKLLTALDSDAFEERESATARLSKLGDLAEPAVRKALEAKPSPEARRRLAGLTDKLDGPITIPEQARELRCVEVLEHIGSADARGLLDELGKGAGGARLAREAKAALARLLLRKE
jgi:WD40 repeat protein